MAHNPGNSGRSNIPAWLKVCTALLAAATPEEAEHAKTYAEDVLEGLFVDGADPIDTDPLATISAEIAAQTEQSAFVCRICGDDRPNTEGWECLGCGTV